MRHNHTTVLCPKCGGIVKQCRCPKDDNVVDFSLCDKCKEDKIIGRKNKSRAWDPIDKKMYYEEGNRVIFEYFNGVVGLLHFDPEEERMGSSAVLGLLPGKVMRFTSLRDMKKKDIYEDDILIDMYHRWFVVFWKENEASFWVRKYNEEEIFPMYDLMDMQVVGNIHEDPELLKVQ